MTAKEINRASTARKAAARDFYGYGPYPPHPHWPGDARIAINLNLNFEAGGERSLLEGDNQSEDVLNDIGFPAYFGVRSPIVETVFEYGPRVGVWRLLRIFKQFDIRISILGVVARHAAVPGSRAGLSRRRARDRQPWLALDRLPQHGRGRGARACPARHRGNPAR